MENSVHSRDEDDLKYIAALVAGMPDAEPPDALIHSVMKHVRPKKLPLLKRVWLKARAPIPVTPLKMATAGALIVLFLVSAGLFLQGPDDKESSWIGPEVRERGFKTVILSLDLPDASRVDVIGSFNRWTPGDYQMQWDKTQGIWRLALQLEGGRYEYAFLVDGERVLQDPKALLQQDDGFGNKNSVLIVERNDHHETEI